MATLKKKNQCPTPPEVCLRRRDPWHGKYMIRGLTPGSHPHTPRFKKRGPPRRRTPLLADFKGGCQFERHQIWGRRGGGLLFLVVFGDVALF